MLETTLAEIPRETVAALTLADAALAQALGWKHMVPVLAAGLKRGDLRKRSDDLRLACHWTVTVSAVEPTRLAANLARRPSRLQAVAPQLRARGAEETLNLFLSRDAIFPGALLTRTGPPVASATGWRHSASRAS